MDNQPHPAIPSNQENNAETVRPDPTVNPVPATGASATDISSSQPVVVVSDHTQVTPQTSSSPIKDTTPQMPQTVIYGQNTNKGLSNNNFMKFWLIIGCALFLVLVVGAFLYFWYLPTTWANNYLNTIRSPYQEQADQIKAVYQSINRPVFSNANTSVASNTQDLNYINGVLKTSTHNTVTLQTKDQLRVLPGTTWLHNVTVANNQHQAMEQYVVASKGFLTNYQTLVTYVSALTKIGQSQLPQLLADFNKVNSSVNDRAALSAACQVTTTDLQNFTNQVKALKPSTDVKQFNDNLLNDLSGMHDGLQNLTIALQGTPTSGILDSAAEFVSADEDFGQLVESNPTANLQTSSSIQAQIANLEATNPLK